MGSGADVASSSPATRDSRARGLSLWLEHLDATTFGIALPPPDAGAYVALQPKLESGKPLRHPADREGVFTLLDEWRPDVVFHLAAQSLVPEGYHDPIGTFETNVAGTVNVISAAVAAGARVVAGGRPRQGLRQRRHWPSVHRVRPARWTRPVQRLQVLRRHRCPLLAFARRECGSRDGCCPSRQRDRRRRRRRRSPAARQIVARGIRRCPTPIAEPGCSSTVAVRRGAVARLPAAGGTAPHRQGPTRPSTSGRHGRRAARREKWWGSRSSGSAGEPGSSPVPAIHRRRRCYTSTPHSRDAPSVGPRCSTSRPPSTGP